MPLTLDYKLFVGIHVPEIMVSRNPDKVVDGNSSPLSKSTKKDGLLKLKEVSKSLEETIRSSTLRKKNMDRLIKMMSKEEDVLGEKKVGSEEDQETASEEKEESSED